MFTDSDYLNVHSKRKKENTLTNEESNNSKKYKMSNNNEIILSSASPSPLPSPSPITPPIMPNNYNKRPSNLNTWISMFKNWSHNERLIAFDSLVTNEICDIQQLRHLLSIIEPQLQRDFISLLPKELSLYVLSFLDPPDLLRAAQTCRYWRILCEDNLLWREKCREEGLLEDKEALSDLFRKRIDNSKLYANKSELKSDINSEQNCQTSSFSSTSSSDTAANANSNCNSQGLIYKLAYLQHKNIEYNWRYGILNYNTTADSTFSNQIETSIEENNPSCANTRLGSSTFNEDCKKNSATSTTFSKKSRKLKEILHLKGHEDHVITCLQFNPTSNIIVSGSDDNTLRVWSSITGRCFISLTGHTGGVWSSQLSNDNIVISGSTDRTLRVWNALNGECLHVLYGHTSTVRCMALHGKQVVSGSRDATLRVWDIGTGQCVHVLVGHMAAVRCVQFNGKICVSGAYDYLVKVWDVATETCLHTLEGHSNRVYSLQFDGRHIVSGSLDTSIRVWCASTGKLKHTLIGHQSLTSGMQLRNNILVSGNADSTVRVWDINTGKCLQTLSGDHKHQSAVTCLQFNSKFVITSSDDGTVKLWDLKNGEFIRNLLTLPSGGSGGVVWRIRASDTKLVCAVGSRNGTEETKLLVLDFESVNSNIPSKLRSPSVFCDYHETSSMPNLLEADHQTQHHSSNCSSSDSLNKLSSFCNNCKHVYLDFEQQQQIRLSSSIPSTLAHSSSAQNQPTPSTNSSASSSSSSSAISSLTSTPSSSNLVLTSISLNCIHK